MRLAQFIARFSAAQLAIGAVAIVIALLVVAMLARIAWTMHVMHRAERAGKHASASREPSALVTSFNRDGAPSDPLNIKITGSDGQLAAAFAAAGWYRADEIDLVTSLRISFDSIFGRKYSTAPVSNLYLFGRKEDYAFERPGTSVRARDHVRLWNTGQSSPHGRPIWIGGATHDIQVEISKTTHLPTHKIASDVDAERTTVVATLAESGWVIAEGQEAGFGQPTEQRNSLGDSYFTDGRRAVLTLANVPVLAPLATHVRSPFGLALAHIFARLLRGRLPAAGRERARQQREARQTRDGSNMPAH